MESNITELFNIWWDHNSQTVPVSRQTAKDIFIAGADAVVLSEAELKPEDESAT